MYHKIFSNFKGVDLFIKSDILIIESELLSAINTVRAAVRQGKTDFSPAQGVDREFRKKCQGILAI